MSVLVECWSLIVPRRALASRHPGGVRAYLEIARDDRWGARWACADEHLTSVSFASRADVRRLAKALETLGIADAGELACVDERDGPTAAHGWLSWRRHDDGWTQCWLAEAEPGELCTPDGWQAPSAMRAGAEGEGEGADRMRLATEDGVEVWLDFATGRLTTVDGPHDPSSPSRAPDDLFGDEPLAVGEEETEGDPGDADHAPRPKILDVVRRALDERGWSYMTIVGAGAAVCSVSGARATYRVVAVADERYEQLACYVVCPTRVPAERRAAASEFLTRANFGMRLGNFELGFEDGEVRFKMSVDVEGGALVTQMVHTMLAAAVGTVERYHDALLTVVYGDATPEEAIREAERG